MNEVYLGIIKSLSNDIIPVESLIDIVALGDTTNSKSIVIRFLPLSKIKNLF